MSGSEERRHGAIDARSINQSTDPVLNPFMGSHCMPLLAYRVNHDAEPRIIKSSESIEL